MLAKRLTYFNSLAIQKAFKHAVKVPGLIDLSIGYPAENTPGNIKNAGRYAITANHTRYTAANGIQKLREGIAEKLQAQNSIAAGPDEVSVTPGLTTAILLAYSAILDPGDEVLIPDPYFPPYASLAQFVGASPVYVDTYPTFQLTAAGIKPHITAKTKALIINTPNNPTGAIYPEDELRKIAHLAKKHNIIIISDEIYEYFAFEGKHFSIGSIYPLTLTLNGFSKAFAMTGWRMGYISGPTEIIEAINHLQQYMVFSSSSIAQYAAIEALRTSPRDLVQLYYNKNKLITSGIRNFTNLHGASGGFFAYPKVPTGHDDINFVKDVLKQKVLLLPGSTFSNKNTHFRMAYVANIDNLNIALKALSVHYNH